MSKSNGGRASRPDAEVIEFASWVRTYQLVYASTSLIPALDSAGREQIEDILRVAGARNPTRGVTGALTFNEACFAQVLEGPHESVMATFAGIKRDPRHADIEILQEGWIGARDFSRWAMAYVGDEAALHFISANVKLKDILLRGRESAALALIEMMKFWLLQHE